MAKSRFYSLLLLALLIVSQIRAATDGPLAGEPERKWADPQPNGQLPAQPPVTKTSGPQAPKWYRDLDADGDGQVSLHEWLAARKTLAEYSEYDSDGDGLITPRELLSRSDLRSELVLRNGSLVHLGEVSKVDDRYRAKTSYKTLTVRLEAGKVYRFELKSESFQSFLYLEDSDGVPLTGSGAPGVGEVCQLSYRSPLAGNYRLVATSVGGFRTGKFKLTIRDEGRPSPLPKGMRDLDSDGDGQVSLGEWLAAGRPLATFGEYDLDSDGLITPRELARRPAKRRELAFKDGQATRTGFVGEADVPHRRKVAYEVVTARLEAGKAYRFEATSATFQALIFLESETGGPVAESFARAVGATSRLKFRVRESGAYRIVVTSVGGERVGPFTLSGRVDSTPDALPQWFRDCDTDRDGQVSLGEWREADRQLAEFAEFDIDGDGLITRMEYVRSHPRPPDLVLMNRQLTQPGEIADAFEPHRGKVAYKALTIRLKAGRTYQFDMASTAFQSCLLLEDEDGAALAESQGRGIGDNCRLTYRATHTGIHRVVATSVGGVRGGPYKLSVRDGAPSQLPPWFDALDADSDGQVSLGEWLTGGRLRATFGDYDTDGDFLITPRELSRHAVARTELVLRKHKEVFTGALSEHLDLYRGKTAFRVVSVQLAANKTYRFEVTSPTFQSFLFLEDPNGAPLAERSSLTIGGTTQIVFRAPKAGAYRIVVTSLGGFRVGEYTLTVTNGVLPPGFPDWFRDLDGDGDGQVSLGEWIGGNRPLDAFGEYDLDGDGLVTAQELARRSVMRPDLQLEKGNLSHKDKVAPQNDPHRGKTAYKALTVRLEAGKTYRFEQTSPSFQSSLHIEDADGVPLVESGAPGVGETCRLNYRPPLTGTYTLVCTSVGGFRDGPFTLTVREGIPRPGAPRWFEELDTDLDGQVSLSEWRAGGRAISEFSEFDRNGDGLITHQELPPPPKKK